MHRRVARYTEEEKHKRMLALVARHRRRAADLTQGYTTHLVKGNPNSDCSGIAQQRKSDLNSEGKCEIQDPNKKEFTGYQP